MQIIADSERPRAAKRKTLSGGAFKSLEASISLAIGEEHDKYN